MFTERLGYKAERKSRSVREICTAEWDSGGALCLAGNGGLAGSGFVRFELRVQGVLRRALKKARKAAKPVDMIWNGMV